MHLFANAQFVDEIDDSLTFKRRSACIKIPYKAVTEF